MRLRQIVPLSFLLLLAGAVVATGLVGHCGATGFVWWMNQEVASPLRGIIHLTEAAPLGPFEIALLILTLAGVVAVLGHYESFSLAANGIVLAALVYAVLFDWNEATANLPDASLLLGVVIAFVSTVYGHRPFLGAQIGRPATA